VWAPKYRKWILRGDIRKRIEELFREIGDRSSVEVDSPEVAELFMSRLGNIEYSILASAFPVAISVLAFIMSFLTFYYEHWISYYDMRIFVDEIEVVKKKKYPKNLIVSTTFINNGTEPLIVNSSKLGIRPNTKNPKVCGKSSNEISRWRVGNVSGKGPIAISGGKTKTKRINFKVDTRINELTGVYEYADKDYSQSDGDLNVCIYISVSARGTKGQKFEAVGLLSSTKFSTSAGSNVTAHRGGSEEWFRLRKVGR